MDVLTRRIAALKLIAELWIAFGLIYFFANLKAIFMPDGTTNIAPLWTPLIGLGITLVLTFLAIVVLIRRASAFPASRDRS